MYHDIIKPYIDRVFALLLLIFLSPVMIMVALLNMIIMGSPIFFKQERPGLNEKIFSLYKFRTMTDEKDENGSLLSDEKRLLWFGKLIRSTSLDELPQLFNILKGEMSFVGPRPLLIEYLPLYNTEQKRRHNVKPGITGWAQVNGRNTISWEQKFHYDVWYVDNISFWLDMKILLLTILKVIKRSDIYAQEYTTMEKFKGS